MSTSFTLLVLSGGAIRLGFGLILFRTSGWYLTMPHLLAAGVLVLAGLPDFIKPVPYPFPVSLTLGFLLPDLILGRRAWR
jgi:hypothetical protein